jgi:hypothetical protein
MFSYLRLSSVLSPLFSVPQVYQTCGLTRRDEYEMFAFFSNRLGCLGSLFVSIIGTIILLIVMRGCGTHW